MMYYYYLNSLLAILLISTVFKANAQISTPCTSSMISTFTPCLSYVTSSSGSGASPTEQCCNSLKSLMATGMDCACLIVTGNVPLSIPFINRNLAISLPQVCSSSVPVQCKATGAPLPAPGPVLLGPSAATAPAALRSHSPEGSKAATVGAPPPEDQSLDLSPTSPDMELSPSASNPGVRPVVNNPNSASTLSFQYSLVLVVLIGIMSLKFFS